MTLSRMGKGEYSSNLLGLDGSGDGVGVFRRSVIRQLARQIVTELLDGPCVPSPESSTVSTSTCGGGALGIGREERALAKADKKAGKILRKMRSRRLDDTPLGLDEEGKDEIDVEDGQFSNLKYSKTKYKNFHSLLRYIESPREAGGVKLVIMNFND